MVIKKRWLQKEIVKAVHDNDLETFLSSLGILKGVTEGVYRCAVCSKPVNLENLGAVSPREGKIEVICDASHCMSRIDLTKA